MSDSAENFDPFMESQEEWENFVNQPFYDPETQEFGYYEDEQFHTVQTAPLSENVVNFINEPRSDPTPVPKTIASQIQPDDPTQQFDDRTQFIPTPMFVPLEDGTIYFKDSAFAKSFLCSTQGVTHPKLLTGCIIIPAKFVSRLRSGPATHGSQTWCYYAPENLMSVTPI